MKKLQPKSVKGRIKTLQALPYKGNMVYLRLIDEDIFEWILVFKGQVYSSYMIIKPGEGKTKLSKDEIKMSAGVVWRGAMATIDTLLGVKLDNKIKEKAKLVAKVKPSEIFEK